MKTSPNRIVMIICVFFIVFVLFNWKTLFKTAESFRNHKEAIKQYRTRIPYTKDISKNIISYSKKWLRYSSNIYTILT